MERGRKKKRKRERESERERERGTKIPQVTAHKCTTEWKGKRDLAPRL